MEDANVILVTIKEIFGLLLALSALSLGSIQYVKEKVGLEGNKAEVLSLVVGFLLSGLVGWYWVDAQGYQLELGQWIGVGISVVVGGIAPSGGYKLLGVLAGSR